MKHIKTLVFTAILALALVGCTSQQGQMKLITGEQAKAYALSAAGVDTAKATVTQLTLEARDGIDYYSVKLTSGGTEYSYNIDALTGAVLPQSDKADTKPTDAPAAPSVAETPSATPVPPTPLTEDEAKSKAIAHANISADEVIFVKFEKDRDDGKEVYEIEFRTIYGEEYDYKIDVYSGAVVDFDYDAKEYKPEVTPRAEPTAATTPAPTPEATPAKQSPISEDEAKAKALEHANVSADDVTFVKCKKDRDDGKEVYEIEFYTKNGKEYDYEIDIYSGKILDFDYDAEDYTPPVGSSTLTAEQAKAKALEQVPGATEADIREFEIDHDDGRIEYEGSIVYNGIEYEFEIDGYSGAIRSWETERVGR